MGYKLYLDDIRDPKDSGYSSNDDWEICRTPEEAMQTIKVLGCPYFISFDHDMGMGTMLTGMDLAKWIVKKNEKKEIFLPSAFSFKVHSANPIGAENIRSYLNNYLEMIR